MVSFIGFLTMMTVFVCINAKEMTFGQIKEKCREYQVTNAQLTDKLLKSYEEEIKKEKADKNASPKYSHLIFFDGKGSSKDNVQTLRLQADALDFSLEKGKSKNEKLADDWEIKSFDEKYGDMDFEKVSTFALLSKDPSLIQSYGCYWHATSANVITVFMVKGFGFLYPARKGRGLKKDEEKVLENWEKSKPIQKVMVLLGLASQMNSLHTVVKVALNRADPKNIRFTDQQATNARFNDFLHVSKFGEEFSYSDYKYIDCEVYENPTGDVQNDIWELGLAFLEMITQSKIAKAGFPTISLCLKCSDKDCHRQKKILEEAKKKLEANNQWIGDLESKFFSDLILKMLEIKRADRIKTVDCVMKHLEALLAALKLEPRNPAEIEKLLKVDCEKKRLVSV